MNEAILYAINGWMGTSPSFDEVLLHLASNPLFKGMAPLFIFWWLWGIEDARSTARRLDLFVGLLVAAVAVLLCRAVVELGPHVLRPIHNPDLDIIISPFLDPTTLAGENAFPSDHATLTVALSVVMLRQSLGWGLLALFHSVTLSLIARVYFGFHAPSDVLGGAAIGAVTILVLTPPAKRGLQALGLEIGMARYPQLVMVFLFALSLQMATMFTSARYFLDAVGTALSRLFG